MTVLELGFIGIITLVMLNAYMNQKKIKIVSETKGKPYRHGEDPFKINMSKDLKSEIYADSESRGPLSESLGALYGTRRGHSYVAKDFENYEGETVKREGGARFQLREMNEHVPEDMTKIGYIHGHRWKPTPVKDVPDQLKDKWSKSTKEERILFPSKNDMKRVQFGELILITDHLGHYRAWSRDEKGRIYSPKTE